jgi:hypothetical protein
VAEAAEVVVVEEEEEKEEEVETWVTLREQTGGEEGWTRMT